MSIKTFFSKLGDCLQQTEMFGQPRKNIPGKWQLFEYYFETGNELFHFQKEELKVANEMFEMEILASGEFSYSSNLSLTLIRSLKNGEWSVSKNYITFLSPGDFRNNTEFQFAFEKGNLKLLKKDAFGKIEFFGFFRRMED